MLTLPLSLGAEQTLPVVPLTESKLRYPPLPTLPLRVGVEPPMRRWCR